MDLTGPCVIIRLMEAPDKSAQIRKQILEGIAQGEKDVREGRVLTQEQFEKKMRRWLKPDATTQKRRRS
jgi:predicted transcriptional regulator